MGHKFFRKLFSFLLSFLILFQGSAPYLLAFAQEATDSTPSAEIVVEPSPSPSPIPTPDPTPEISPSPTPTPEPTSALGPESAPLIETSASGVWTANDNGGYTTSGNVMVGVTYSAPQDSKVSVTFKTLPLESGKLTIKELKLNAEQQTDIGAFSDTAYDITSDMADGTFVYDLTLPIPEAAKDKTIEIKSGETVDEVVTNAEIVDEPKEIKSETITVTGLNHFTVFVLVNDVDNGGTASTTDDIVNGMLSIIQDAYIKANATTTNFGDTTSLIIRSSDNDNPDENWKALVQFNLASIPSGSIINSAKVRLFMTARPSATIQRNYDIYRITQSWVEGEVKWNNQPTATVSATSSTQTPITNDT